MRPFRAARAAAGSPGGLAADAWGRGSKRFVPAVFGIIDSSIQK